jgi:aconitate hydratase
MGVGEGGGEIVRQLLGNTWDLTPAPPVVLVWLTGTPRPGVGPHDAAIALCGAVYKNNFVKNAVLEFAGPGIASLGMDYRIGIDVMTTETACLSSIWETDAAVEEYYAVHGRLKDYRPLRTAEGALYDRMVEIDLSSVEPMAALPFHPSEAVTVRVLAENPGDILREVERRAAEQYGGKVSLHLTDRLVGGRLRVEQGIIAGCSGGMYDNLAEAAAILGATGAVSECSLSVYPPSIPVQLEMSRTGLYDRLTEYGAIVKPCFCGPCFGAGDVPANGTLSIRHTTRNFPNREGSRPGDGQLSAVLLMDARSIAATVGNGGFLTPADEVEYTAPEKVRRAYDRTPYERRCWFGFGKADPAQELRFGPNIVPWPEIPALAEDLLLRLAAVIHDEVTTTDELIPSGETSSYRSNPLKLASFTLSRREPAYVGRTAAAAAMEAARKKGETGGELLAAAEAFGLDGAALGRAQVASVIFAEKPGDGSAREQAASCQRVLGGAANICREYATKRYRSNCVNWGMLPFTIDADTPFDYDPDDLIYIPGIRAAVERGDEEISARVLHSGTVTPLTLRLVGFTQQERQIVLAGCLMNWYKNDRS